MKLSAFKFELPEGLIAKYPKENRDESRLMIVHKDTKKIEHRVFKDIINFFDEKDVIVLNNTKVFPALLVGNKEKTDAHIEVFLLREINPEKYIWDVLVEPARKIRVGNKLYFGRGELTAEVIDNTTSRGRIIQFLDQKNNANVLELINVLGKAPIPKDLKRPVEKEDRKRFQTIFAKHPGAVVAPSSCLHFTTQLIKKLQLKGVEIAPITLHISLSSMRTIETEDLSKHRIGSENFQIPSQTSEIVNKALEEKKNVCVVGTSSMRALESSVNTLGRLKEESGWTDKFIFPPFNFKIGKSMITNFHKPMTSLLIMACAFGGYDTIVNAYEVAKRERYRFLNYGDAMLII